MFRFTKKIFNNNNIKLIKNISRSVVDNVKTEGV
jgi:hypothetical protein